MPKKQEATARASLWSIFATYFSAAKKYPAPAILVLFFYGLGHLAADVVMPLFYRRIIDFIGTTEPGPAAWQMLFHILLSMAGLALFFNICFRAADFLVSYFESNVMRKLANDAFSRLQQHSYSFFTGNFTGSLVAKVKRFVRSFENISDRIFFDIWFTVVHLVGIITVLSFTLPALAIVFSIWFIFYFLLSLYFVRLRLRFDFNEAAADSAVTGELSDAITNILNLKIFASGVREKARFAKQTHKEHQARLKAWNMGNTLYTVQGFIMATLEIVGMYVALKLWTQGSISTGTVVLVQIYFASFMQRVWNIGRAMSQIFKSLSDAGEMVSILEQPLEVNDPAHPEQSRISKGSIDFNGVGFHYRKGPPIFSGFNLHIPAGQKVGIVGPSGAGKSTIFKLLLRFLDVTEGAITIDEQDIRHLLQDDVRSHISYVPQDPILFHRSLFENIVYAKPHATKEEVIVAAKRAHAHEFISKLPHGYDTLVGERGVKLSGGERQRVALARIILKDAPILLLDEATSSLDSLSERYIQEQLVELMEGRTTLAIAHRISTITRMDRIIVLEGGSVVEDGTHGELLAKKGLYASLWSHQSQGFIMDGEDEQQGEDEFSSEE